MSIVPSIVAQYLKPRVGSNVAAEVFHWALPVEDIADPGRPQPLMRPLAPVHPDIAEFMLSPQEGARRVAKTMLEAVHSLRRGQFSRALATNADAGQDMVFPEQPTDRGHFIVPYLAHILSGLRRWPPAYVEDLFAGRTPPRWVIDAVTGIVVIRDPTPDVRDPATRARRSQRPTGWPLSLVR